MRVSEPKKVASVTLSILVSMIFVTFSFVSPALASSKPKELLVNGGFETGSLAPWIDQCTGGVPPCQYTVESVVVHHGKYAVGLASGSGGDFLSQGLPGKPITATKQDTFSFSIHFGDALSNAYFMVLLMGKNHDSYQITYEVASFKPGFQETNTTTQVVYQLWKWHVSPVGKWDTITRDLIKDLHAAGDARGVALQYTGSIVAQFTGYALTQPIYLDDVSLKSYLHA